MHDNFILKKNIFFSSIFQKFLQLEKYSRWKINILSIFGQHKILYKKIKKNLIFEILQITLFFKNLFREYTMLYIIKTFFEITII
jgi:hypothetical protein